MVKTLNIENKGMDNNILVKYYSKIFEVTCIF